MNKEKFDKKCDYVSRLLIAYVLILLILGLIMEVIIIKGFSDANAEKPVKQNHVEITEENFNNEFEYEIMVCITRYGTKYHIDDCPYAKNTYDILNLSEARIRGYKPCSYCCK